MEVQVFNQDPITLCSKPSFWREVRDPETVKRALRVAAIVGTILIAINQGDAILAGVMPPIWKIILTYCVPYSVSSYSAAAFKVALLKTQQAEEGACE
ncbi:MAG: nitrate/nitrite transporter NrtS [Pseudomonadota bacterium]